MDLFFINDLEEQKFRVGVLMIDVFDVCSAYKGKKGRGFSEWDD